MRARAAVAGDESSVVRGVTRPTERVYSLGHEMETGVKKDCHGMLVEPSWLPLVICVLRSRQCNVESSRSTFLNAWMEKS